MVGTRTVWPDRVKRSIIAKAEQIVRAIDSSLWNPIAERSASYNTILPVLDNDKLEPFMPLGIRAIVDFVFS